MQSSLMLMFYCCFVSGWSGSAIIFMMSQLVHAYKEQLVDYYWVSILLNLGNIAVQSVFDFLYRNVPLFNTCKKTSRMTTFRFTIDIIYNSQPYLLLSLKKTTTKK